MDEELRAVLVPFLQAYLRLHHFGSASDNMCLYAESGNCQFELMAAMGPNSYEPHFAENPEGDVLLNVGHLRRLYELLGGRNELPDLLDE